MRLRLVFQHLKRLRAARARNLETVLGVIQGLLLGAHAAVERVNLLAELALHLFLLLLLLLHSLASLLLDLALRRLLAEAHARLLQEAPVDVLDHDQLLLHRCRRMLH